MNTETTKLTPPLRVAPIDYSGLPEHCREGMQAYIEEGRPCGSFLTAILCNDLVGAFGAADDINSRHIRDYASFLYNEAPAPCWGDRARFDAWKKRGGLKGGRPIAEEA